MKRIALICGASSGLGAETARQLACESSVDELWLVARRAERLEALAAELTAQGKASRVWPADLTVAAERVRLSEALAAEVAVSDCHLHWVVLAAGLGRTGRLGPEQLPAVEQMLQLNIVALTDLSARLLPLTRGHALLFASVAAYVPQPYFAVYAASKSYVLSLSQALAVEYPQVRVTAVCPNPVETEFFDELGGSAKGIKKIGVEQAEKVVRVAIRRCKMGKWVSLSSPLSKAIRLASKLLPHRLIIFVEKKIGVFK